MNGLFRQVSWFVAVGCAAALTHWCVAIGCVKLTGAAPLLANFVGWLVAFVVSFAGHFHLTFRHALQSWHIAGLRFLAVSALGFAVNEAAYAWLLAATGMRYDILLALILIAVAGMTFVLSRLWAFRRNDRP